MASKPPSPPAPPPASYLYSTSPKFIKYFVTAVLEGNQNALQEIVITLGRSMPLDKIQAMFNRKYSQFNDHTALYVAVTKDYPEICKLLLSKGNSDPHLDASYTIAKNKGGEIFAAIEPRLLGKLLDVGECSLCEEVTSLYRFECGHFFCYDCSCKWAKECAMNITPKCPQLNCPLPVHINVFKNLLTPSDLDAYTDTLFRISLSISDTFQWCSHCSSGFFLSNHAEGTPCTVSCPDCGSFWCSSCRLQAHSSLTCEEAITKWSFEEKENDIWKTKNAKKCPQCKVSIQRNQGCSHMICRQCKYHFCWVCLGKYLGKPTYGETCECQKK